MIGPFETQFSSLFGHQIDLEALAPREAEELLEIVPQDDFIIYAHRVLLRRSPGVTVVENHRSLSRADIAAKFMSSAEFVANDGRRHRRSMPLDTFIRQTYLDVLGRAPDAGGMQTYTRIGRKWRGKKRILAAMQRSCEGTRTGGGRLERIAGFRRLIFRNRIFRIPVVGAAYAAKRTQHLRLTRIELALAALVGAEVGAMPEDGLLTQLIEALLKKERAASAEMELPLIDPNNPDKAAIDNWVFAGMLRQARRCQDASQGVDR